MQGFFDRGHFDVDTYDEGVRESRSGTDYKAEMETFLVEVDYLDTDPTASQDIVVEALRALRDDGILSGAIQEPSGPVKTWGYRIGRQRVSDVINSSEQLLRDIMLFAIHPDARTWKRIKRGIHPGFYSFYHTEFTD